MRHEVGGANVHVVLIACTVSKKNIINDNIAYWQIISHDKHVQS